MTHTIILNETEKANAKSLYETVMEIYKSCNEQAYLTSPITGECIAVDELLRVAGILDGMASEKVWVVDR